MRNRARTSCNFSARSMGTKYASFKSEVNRRHWMATRWSFVVAHIRARQARSGCFGLWRNRRLQPAGGASNGSVSLVAAISPELTKQFQAGKIIQTIAPIIGGKGGGKPENARGGGKDAAKLDEALAKARTLL